MQQQFSLAAHPTLPIMLFSDGFLVTVVQLAADLSSTSVMRGLVLDSAVYLKKLLEQENLDMTVADAYKLSKGRISLSLKSIEIWLKYDTQCLLFGFLNVPCLSVIH